MADDLKKKLKKALERKEIVDVDLEKRKEQDREIRAYRKKVRAEIVKEIKERSQVGE